MMPIAKPYTHIGVIEMLCGLWPGRRMEDSSLQEVTTVPCGCGMLLR